MKKKSFFWVGYSDLMTSLFFLMLVLFVVALVQIKGLNVTIEEQEKILRLNEQFKPLKQDSSFYYLPECNKYIAKDLMGIEIFNPKQTTIKKEYVKRIKQVGDKIESFLGKLNSQNSDMSYLLIIEGNMANKYDYSISKDNNWGYKKSYERALAVYKLWLKNNISFRRYNVEVMLCGSGFNGLCRDKKEENNKRFSIQIIPKVKY